MTVRINRHLCEYFCELRKVVQKVTGCCFAIIGGPRGLPAAAVVIMESAESEDHGSPNDERSAPPLNAEPGSPAGDRARA